MLKTLRDWAVGSYDRRTGRAASSLEEAGTGNKGNHTTAVATQIEEASAGGVGGAPGVSGLNRSGSADPGRRKWGGSECP
jgi:hypothetical protein